MKTIGALGLIPLFLLPPAGWAKLSGKDKKEIEQMVSETLYLRIDVPTNAGVQPFLEVSATGYGWERLVNAEQAKRKNKPSGVYWAFFPNDTLKWGSPRYERDTIIVWFEGQRDELKIKFVGINTLDDFRKAFDLAFSRVPLQQQNPDWPAEVQTAIAERRVVGGMTKKQASCVVGIPLKTEKEGTDAEIWYPRQDTLDPRRGSRAQTGFPKKLKFVGDQLMTIEE